MAEFKLVISHKDGKSEQKDVKDAQAKPFLGKKIGDQVKGDAIGMPGFEFEVRGGSDRCGFPMRSDVPGTQRKRILAVQGVGLKKKRHGQRQRKTVCGNTVHGDISQINLKVVKAGKTESVEPAKSEDSKPDSATEKPAKSEGSKPDSATEKPAKSEGSKPDSATEKPAKSESSKPDSATEKPAKSEDSKPDSATEKPAKSK